MDTTGYFARDYRQARRKFIEAAEAAGAEIDSHKHPGTGPDGGDLYMDAACLGRPEADRVLAVTTGIHGAEGFCGSGAMVGWLRAGELRALPENVRVVLVHALNPHGFAWLRRVNEDNIDLNRNFQDFDAGLPENPDYDALHRHLLPDDWAGGGRDQVLAALRAYAAEHGEKAYQAALSRGQHGHPDGLFYGGRAPAWSNATLRAIYRRHVLPGAGWIAHQDYHTGLGPHGTADLISDYVPGTAHGERLYAIYGEGLSNPALNTSTSVPLTGVMNQVLRQALPDGRALTITAEFGTYPLPQVLEALLADNWLHQRGEVDSELGRQIKAQVRRAFYPDTDDWRELVTLRSRQLLRRALRGLAALPV